MLENGDSSARRWSRDRYEARTWQNGEGAIAPAEVRKAIALSMLLALVFSICLAATLAANGSSSPKAAPAFKTAKLLQSDIRRPVVATGPSR